MREERDKYSNFCLYSGWRVVKPTVDQSYGLCLRRKRVERGGGGGGGEGVESRGWVILVRALSPL